MTFTWAIKMNIFKLERRKNHENEETAKTNREENELGSKLNNTLCSKKLVLGSDQDKSLILCKEKRLILALDWLFGG